MREQLSSGDMCGARIARSVAVGRRSGNGEWETERPFGRYGRKSRRRARARIRTPQKNSTVVLSLQSKVENGSDHETSIFVDPSHENSIFAACHMNLCKKYLGFPPIVWEVPRCARARARLLRHLTLISDLGLRTRTYAHPFAEPASTARAARLLFSCSEVHEMWAWRRLSSDQSILSHFRWVEHGYGIMLGKYDHVGLKTPSASF